MVSKTVITLEVRGPGAQVSGWAYLWLKYVYGFLPAFHCGNCLRGRYSALIRRDMRCGSYRLTETTYRYLYLCGVAEVGPRDPVSHHRRQWESNLHFPLEYAPGERCSITAYNGEVFTATNARVLPIPELPLEFAGRPARFTTCRNWRFGVAYYGLREDG